MYKIFTLVLSTALLAGSVLLSLEKICWADELGESPAAQTNPTLLRRKKKKKETEAKDDAGFFATFAANTSHSLYDYGDGSSQSNIYGLLTAGYKFSNELTLSSSIDYFYDLKNQNNTDPQAFTTAVQLPGLPIISERLKVLSSLTLALPLDRADQAKSLEASLIGTLKFESNPKFLFSKRFSTAFGLGATKNFNQYTTSANGAVNTQYLARLFYQAGWAFSEKFSFNVEVDHFNTFSYQNSVGEFYAHSEEFDWQATRALTLLLGHQLGSPFASVWKDNGQDYNYQLIDQQNSYVYAGFSLSFK